MIQQPRQRCPECQAEQHHTPDDRVCLRQQIKTLTQERAALMGAEAGKWQRAADDPPTEQDADDEGGVWYWTPEIGLRYIQWRTVRQYQSIKGAHRAQWATTGLRRPTLPTMRATR